MKIILKTETPITGTLETQTPLTTSTSKNGPVGRSGTITIGDVETLEPTESAYVTNVGTPEDAILDMGIPQGVKGDTGEVTEAELTAALATKQDTIGYTPANDSAVVHLTGTETITGAKTLNNASNVIHGDGSNLTGVLPSTTLYGSSIDFSVDTLTLKDQNGNALDTAIIDIPTSTTTTPFSPNSGNIDSNGDSDLVSYSSGTLSFKVGTTYPNLVVTPANSKPTFTRESIADLDMSGYADGTYNIFVGETGNAEAYANTIYVQTDEPVPEATFTQPTLTADGTLGGNAFACASSGNIGDAYAWRALDGAYPGLGWHSTNGSSWWFKVYNPLALNITNFQIRNSNDSMHKAITAGNVQGSNDGTNWTTLTTWTNSNVTANATWNIGLTSNTSYYKYYLINITSSAYSGYAVISEIVITATTVGAIENNIWLKTLEPLEAFKYSGSAWAEFNLVPIGSATVASGVITSVETFDFNQNGYNLNIYSPVLNVIPDYTKGVSLSVGGTTNTIEKNGWIVMNVGSASSTAAYAYINDIQVGRTLNAPGSYEARFSITAMVSKDDKVRISTTNGYITFYPMKGVN